MALDRFLAEIESGRDVFIGLSGGDEPGYLPLAGRQRGRGGPRAFPRGAAKSPLPEAAGFARRGVGSRGGTAAGQLRLGGAEFGARGLTLPGGRERPAGEQAGAPADQWVAGPFADLDRVA